MNTNALIAKLSNIHNGTFFKVTWMTDVPCTAAAKRAGNVVYKFTSCVVRKGIRYVNQKSVQMKVEHGKELTHELPWGNWMEGHEGLLIEHKGKTYVRLYPAMNVAKVQYYLGGRPIDKNELMNMGIVQKSYWNKTGKPDALTVNTANIQDICIKTK